MPRLNVGDRIRLAGGYFNPPEWMRGRDAYHAVVLRFFDNEIDGRSGDEQLSASIEFEEELEFEGVRGRFGYLTGRWDGQKWDSSGVVHLNLTAVEVRNAKDMRELESAWLESNVSYEVDAV